MQMRHAHLLFFFLDVFGRSGIARSAKKRMAFLEPFTTERRNMFLPLCYFVLTVIKNLNHDNMVVAVLS